jgi:hypothetical protein
MITFVQLRRTFLMDSRWTKVKGLFILTRYTPFLLLIVHLYRAFSCTIHHDRWSIDMMVLFFSELNSEREFQCMWTVDLLVYERCLLHSLAEMPITQQYFLMYVHRAQYVYTSLLSSAITGFSLISVISSECISPSFITGAHSWPESSRFFHPQNICTMEQE